MEVVVHEAIPEVRAALAAVNNLPDLKIGETMQCKHSAMTKL